MNPIDCHHIFWGDFSNISIGDHEPVPSTSGGLTNQVTLNTAVPYELKNYSWRQACMELSTIFPNVDPEFMKQIYIRNEHLPKKEDKLKTVINEILGIGKNDAHPEIPLGNLEPKVNVDEVLQYLLSVFPDANPRYLKTIASKNSDNPDELKKFVEEKLETRDYPTKGFHFLSRHENQREFVDSFNVEEFLKIVPEPVQVFENSERKFNYDVEMFELLKSHFRKLKLSTISDTYTRCSFNALLAFESLQTMKFELKKSRKKTTMKTENSHVLHEFTFIKNKQRIKTYIKQKKEREEKIYQKMKDNKELLECECCFEELPATTLVTTCEEGHVFCTTCMRKGTETKLASGVVRISCFADCDNEFSLISLQKVLEPSIFKILLGKIQLQEIMSAKIEGLDSCPFCHFAAIPPENEKIFKCMNPDCGQESCRLCKKRNHLPKECEILEKSKKARLILEEVMTAALVRKCGQCGKKFIKDTGCNSVTCSCGAHICYFCGELSTSHAHMNNGRCGLYITPSVDAESVVFVAKKVESELLKLDPNLKIDANSILPSVPGSSQIYTNYTENFTLPTHSLRASSTLPEL